MGEALQNGRNRKDTKKEGQRSGGRQEKEGGSSPHETRRGEKGVPEVSEKTLRTRDDLRPHAGNQKMNKSAKKRFKLP